nr:hypothetical protein [Acidithiobacillus ferrianus]
MKYRLNVITAYDLSDKPAISNEQPTRGRYNAICGSWRISTATTQTQLPTLEKITALNTFEDPPSRLFAFIGDRKKYSRDNSSNTHEDNNTANNGTADTTMHHHL